MHRALALVATCLHIRARAMQGSDLRRAHANAEGVHMRTLRLAARSLPISTVLGASKALRPQPCRRAGASPSAATTDHAVALPADFPVQSLSAAPAGSRRHGGHGTGWARARPSSRNTSKRSPASERSHVRLFCVNLNFLREEGLWTPRDGDSWCSLGDHAWFTPQHHEMMLMTAVKRLWATFPRQPGSVALQCIDWLAAGRGYATFTA